MDLTLVNFDAPDETRTFELGRFEVYRVGPATLGRATYKPGWKWSAHVGGPAARLAQDCIRKVEVLEYPELGMEAIWRIEVVDFPAFVVVDDKGSDFFADVSEPTLQVSFRR